MALHRSARDRYLSMERGCPSPLPAPPIATVLWTSSGSRGAGVYVCVCVYGVCVSTYKHMCTHAHTHTCTHTRTCTHTCRCADLAPGVCLIVLFYDISLISIEYQLLNPQSAFTSRRKENLSPSRSVVQMGKVWSTPIKALVKCQLN